MDSGSNFATGFKFCYQPGWRVGGVYATLRRAMDNLDQFQKPSFENMKIINVIKTFYCIIFPKMTVVSADSVWEPNWYLYYKIKIKL